MKKSKYNYCPELKIMADLKKIKHYCPTCGHAVIIPNNIDKVLCGWCGHYIYKNKNIEFKNKLKLEMKKRKEEENGKI